MDRRLHAELSARRSADQSALARSALERDQSVARLRSAECKVVREVRQAAMQLDQNRQRIDTTRLARELSEQRLDAEQKRFEVGMSTNFNVIQAQRDLAVARNNELQAQLDYQLALIAFKRSSGSAVRSAGRSRIWRPRDAIQAVTPSSEQRARHKYRRHPAGSRPRAVFSRRPHVLESTRSQHVERRVVLFLDNPVGNQLRGQRREQYAVAVVSGRVNEPRQSRIRTDRG